MNTLSVSHCINNTVVVENVVLRLTLLTVCCRPPPPSFFWKSHYHPPPPLPSPILPPTHLAYFFFTMKKRGTLLAIPFSLGGQMTACSCVCVNICCCLCLSYRPPPPLPSLSECLFVSVHVCMSECILSVFVMGVILKHLSPILSLRLWQEKMSLLMRMTNLRDVTLPLDLWL